MVTRLGLVNSKRGEFQLGAMEIFFALVFLFAAAMFLVILYYAWGEISTPMETALNSAIPEGETAFNVSTMNSNVDTSVTLFNVMYPFIVLGLIIFVIVSAFFANSNPMFLFISIVLLSIVILIGVIFSNIYQQLTVTTTLSTAGDNFGIIKLFMENLPIIITVIAIITIFVLMSFGRRGGASTQGL